jgi:phosphoribosylformylglycinamidine cyclo-ligase
VARSYREAGVNIDEARRAMELIGRAAAATATPAVLGGVGGFGSLFRFDPTTHADPVLVASTDGVGSKLQLAIALGCHGTIGVDLVNHCINDIAVHGADPLFFLDYLAVGKLHAEVAAEIVSGIADACAAAGVALVGGETAELPDLYAGDDYDLAGFIVGVVEKDKALTGTRVKAGDHLLGLPSSGLHTNGYTLARRVLLEHMGLDVHATVPELGTTLARALLAPHRSYLSALEPLLERDKVAALAHITGGGFVGNVPRVLPPGLGAVIRLSAWSPPPLFRLIQKGGDVDEAEMYRTFNMGIGMVVVVAPSDLHDVEHSLERRGETPVLVGRVVEGEGVRLE